jgi:hypothetical protein
MKLALKHTLAAIILVLIFAVPVAADQFEDADIETWSHST